MKDLRLYLRLRQDLRDDACIHLLGTVDNIKDTTLDFRVPCLLLQTRLRDQSLAACLEKGPTLESSVRFSLP